MGFVSVHDSLDDMMSKRMEDRRRQESIDAYKEELADRRPEDSTGQPGFDPEPVMTLSPAKRKDAALRQMLYDLKGVRS